MHGSLLFCKKTLVLNVQITYLKQFKKKEAPKSQQPIVMPQNGATARKN